MENVGFKTVS